MNSKRLGDYILLYVAVSSGSRSAAVNDALISLGTALQSSKAKKPTDAVVTWRSRLGMPSTGLPKNDLSDEFRMSVLGLSGMTELVGTSAAKLAINEINTFVHDYSRMNLKDLIEAFQPSSKSSVSYYVRMLREFQKDEVRYPELMHELKSDPAIKVEQTNEIANELTGIKKTRSKKAALIAIEDEHRFYIDAKRRREAAGGKSAA